MSEDRCERSWEVQAALDGRLNASSRSAFERHLARCRACQKERDELQKLFAELHQIASDIDEVSLRRLRQQTLEKANRALTGRKPALQTRAALAGVLALCASAFAVAIYARGTPATTPAVAVVPEANARWQRSSARDVERIELSAGVLHLHVKRARRAQRLVVAVPEGEIEDVGTVFSVTVQNGKTAEISVSEGRVLFRRRGLPDLQLVAGSTWRPVAQEGPRAPAPSHAVEPMPPAPSAAGASLHEAAPPAPEPPSMDRHDAGARFGNSDLARPHGSAQAGPSRSRAPARTPASAPAVESRVQRQEDVSTDGQREDASYLRVLDLLRRGRNGEARVAAEAYLRSFPEGFRRREVELVRRSLAAPDTAHR